MGSREEGPVRRVKRAPAMEKRVGVSLDKHGLEMRRFELAFGRLRH